MHAAKSGILSRCDSVAFGRGTFYGFRGGKLEPARPRFSKQLRRMRDRLSRIREYAIEPLPGMLAAKVREARNHYCDRAPHVYLIDYRQPLRSGLNHCGAV